MGRSTTRPYPSRCFPYGFMMRSYADFFEFQRSFDVPDEIIAEVAVKKHLTERINKDVAVAHFNEVETNQRRELLPFREMLIEFWKDA